MHTLLTGASLSILLSVSRSAVLLPQAIAVNLREMFGFRVPIISVVIGEGGSGGALAIGVSNKNLIMEHAVYYVASPEACAAILWKSRDKAATVCTLALQHQPHNKTRAAVSANLIPASASTRLR